MGPGDDLAERGAELVLGKASRPPRAAIVLGSGLGPAADALHLDTEIPFDVLPGFPPAGVPGHAGRLLLGSLHGVPTAVFLGRIHFYEGHDMPLVTLPARLAAAMGVRTLVVTAAVGALDPVLAPGTLVVGTDHLNLMGESPLRGWRDHEGRPAFVDLTTAYDQALVDLVLLAAEGDGLPAARGVYASVPGPAYETPAEVAFLRSTGATVVGMSVVPEAMAAAALGMRCLGLYCVTNRVGVAVSHAEVTEVAAGFAPRLGRLLERVVPELGDGEPTDEE